MHLYNAWLPPPVAEETKREAESFAAVVRSVKESARPDDPDSVYSSLKWISVIELFVRAKSDVSAEDVKELVEFGLELFHASENKLSAQVRWGNILIKLLKKHGQRLSIEVQWRPLYDILMQTHFKRQQGLDSNGSHCTQLTTTVIIFSSDLGPCFPAIEATISGLSLPSIYSPTRACVLRRSRSGSPVMLPSLPSLYSPARAHVLRRLRPHYPATLFSLPSIYSLARSDVVYGVCVTEDERRKKMCCRVTG